MPRVKLDQAQAATIKRLLLEGELSQRAIARMFGVTPPTIYAIKTARTWWYVEPEVLDDKEEVRLA